MAAVLRDIEFDKNSSGVADAALQLFAALLIELKAKPNKHPSSPKDDDEALNVPEHYKNTPNYGRF